MFVHPPHIKPPLQPAPGPAPVSPLPPHRTGRSGPGNGVYIDDEIDGGVEVGGDNVVNAVSYALFDGGVEVGGDNAVFAIEYIADGGVEVGGDGIGAYQIALSGDGGVEVGGDDAVFAVEYIADGGVEAGGDDAPFAVSYALFDGGVEVGGDDADYYAQTSISDEIDGGVEVGGDNAVFSTVAAISDEIDGGAKVGGDDAAENRTSVIDDEIDGGVSVGGRNALVTYVQTKDGVSTSYTEGTSDNRDRAKTDLQNVLRAMRDRIVTLEIFDEENAYIAYGDDDWPVKPEADEFMVLTSTSGSPDSGWVDGGGQHTNRRDQIVEFQVYHRLSTDLEGRDTNRTLDFYESMLPKLKEVVSAFQSHDVLDKGGVVLSIEPVTFNSMGAPRVNKKYLGWDYIPINFTVSYLQDIGE